MNFTIKVKILYNNDEHNTHVLCLPVSQTGDDEGGGGDGGGSVGGGGGGLSGASPGLLRGPAGKNKNRA